MKSLRRLGLGVATLSGLARRGWFIPHRYAASLALPGRNPAYAPIEAIFERAQPVFLETLAEIERHSSALEAIAAEAGRPEPGLPNPRFDQGWFATLDAAAAYAMVRRHLPRRIVEIGSGHSTRFLARALHDAGSDGTILSIDPAPRAAIESLAPRVSFDRRTVQQAGEAPFRDLRAGDLLFIDSSHVLMPGSDCDHLFNRILPLLPTGTLVHIHDIFLPDDYPEAWGWRNYNEQQGVAQMLVGGGWTPLFASHYAQSRLAAHVGAGVLTRLPRHAAAIDASLWLRKA
ncbi:MAG: class I SAM-dependent methyltransferase [Reyranellaceae bacterium]